MHPAGTSARADPPDVQCGTPAWAPFRDALNAYCAKKPKDADCDVASKSFKTCQDAAPEPSPLDKISGSQLAKGQRADSVQRAQDGQLGGGDPRIRLLAHAPVEPRDHQPKAVDILQAEGLIGGRGKKC